MPITSASQATTTIAQPPEVDNRPEPANISLPSTGANPDPRVLAAFGVVHEQEDLFTSPGLHGARDNDPQTGVIYDFETAVHVDQTRISDALNATNHVVSGETPLNTADQQRQFLTSTYMLQEQTLDYSLQGISGALDNRNVAGLEDNFENLRSRYIAAFATSHDDAQRLEQTFDLLHDALLSENPIVKQAAMDALREPAMAASLPPGVANALNQSAGNQIPAFVTAMQQDVDAKMATLRTNLQQSTDLSTLVYNELSRNTSTLAADFIEQSDPNLTDDQLHQVLDILHSGEPQALENAIAHLNTFNPDLAAELNIFRTQQTYIDARFGPAAGRAAAVESLRDQLNLRAGATQDEIFAAANERIPAAVTSKILGSLQEDPQSVEQIASEYEHIPMRQRVSELHEIVRKTRAGEYQENGRGLITDLTRVYGGLSESEALDLSLEYQRVYNSPAPHELMADQLNNIRFGVLGRPDRNLVEVVDYIMSGHDDVRAATLLNAVQGEGGLSAGSLSNDEILQSVFGSMTRAQGVRAFEIAQPRLAVNGVTGDFTQVFSTANFVQNPRPFSQTLPGMGTNVGPANPVSFQILHQNVMQQLNLVDPATRDPATPVTNEQRANARATIQRLLTGASRDDLTMMFGDHPEIARTMLARLVDNPDHNVPGPGGTEITTRTATLQLVEQVAGLGDITALRNGLTYNAASPNGHEAALTTLRTIRTGPAGEQQIALINEVLRSDPTNPTDLQTLTTNYLAAHPGLTTAQKTDLQFASVGLDPRGLADRVRNAAGVQTLSADQLVTVLDSVPTVMRPQIDAEVNTRLEQERVARETAGEAARTPEEIATRRTELQTAVAAEFRELLALRVASEYQAQRNQPISAEFTQDPDARSVMYQRYYGTELGANILNSGNRVTSIISQSGPGQNMDESLYRALLQARQVAEQYGAGAPGATADPGNANYGNAPANTNQLAAQMRRDLFVQEFNAHIAQSNSGTSLHDLMKNHVQSSLWTMTERPVTSRTLGVDFSDLTPTPEVQGNAVDDRLKAINPNPIDPAAIANLIRAGNYTLDQFNADRARIANPADQAQFATRIREHYFRTFHAMDAGARAGNTGIIELNKIPLTNNNEASREALVGVFYGPQYAAQFSELRQEYAALLANDRATPAEYHAFFERVPDITLFQANYNYVTGENMRAQLLGELNPTERTDFNNRYRTHIAAIGGNL